MLPHFNQKNCTKLDDQETGTDQAVELWSSCVSRCLPQNCARRNRHGVDCRFTEASSRVHYSQ